MNSFQDDYKLPRTDYLDEVTYQLLLSIYNERRTGSQQTVNTLDGSTSNTEISTTVDLASVDTSKAKILYPSNGTHVNFFDDGQMKVTWRALEGEWSYTLQLKEADTVIFEDSYIGNDVIAMSAYIYADKISAFNKTKSQDHTVTICLMAEPLID